MKKTILAAALAVLSAGAFACTTGTCVSTGPTNTGKGSVSVSGSGSNVVTSGSSATANSSGAGGTSLSYATNTQSATTALTVGGTALSNIAPNCDTLINGSLSITGVVTTAGSSEAYNLSTGSGSGSAAASGLSFATVTGSGSYGVTNNVGGVKGSVSGTVTGSTTASTGTSASAGTNQSAYSAGVAGGQFVVTASSSLGTSGSQSTAVPCGPTGCGAPTVDTKNATTSVLASTYSDKVTQTGFTVNGVTLANGSAGAIVNSTATGNATAGATGGVSASVTAPVVLTSKP